MSTVTDNAELIRRGYEAFNAADVATLSQLFAEDVTWSTPGDSPVAGLAEGQVAVFTRFGHYGGETNGTFRADLQQVFTGADGRVIGLHRNTGERNGKALDVQCCIVFELDGGRVVSGRETFADVDAWDRFWA